MRIFVFALILLIIPWIQRIEAQDMNGLYRLQYEPRKINNLIQTCEETITSKLKIPNELSIAVAFGYSDTTDEGFNLVTDEWTLKTVVSQLTQKCKYELQGFCEFKSISNNPHEVQLYSREIMIGEGKKLLVKIYLMNSSFDGSHIDNITQFKSEQNIKSENAKQFYSWALKNADIVFYEGHSRDGGGPDFAPPIQKRNGKVNYSWYHKNKPGLKLLNAQLETITTPPVIFGLFSCDSQRHFQNHLSKYLPKSNTIMSTRVVESHFTKEALLISLESILNFECSDVLNKRLNGSSFIVNRQF